MPLLLCYFLGFLLSMLSFIAHAEIHASYDIEPIYHSSKPYLKIRLCFNSAERDTYILNLPYAKIKNLNIVSIEPKTSVLIDNKTFPAHPTLNVPKNTSITLYYEVHGNTNASFKFDNNIDSDKFLLHGANLFIVPSEEYIKAPDIVSMSAHWQLNASNFITNSYSPIFFSLNKNQTQYFTTTYNDLHDTIFIGGAYQRFHLKEDDNDFFIASDLPTSILSYYFEGVKKIVAYQYAQLEDKPSSKNLIIFKENKHLSEGEVAASKHLNVVLLQATLATYKKYPERVLAAFSHEHMHIWFSERLSSADPIYPRWFFEGFNDYFGMKTVHDLHLIPTQYYLDYLNGFILCNHFSPGRSIPSDQIENDYNTSSLLFLQPYARGHLFAIELDYLLRSYSNNTINLTLLFKDYLYNINHNLITKKSYQNKFSMSMLDNLIRQKMGASFSAHYLGLKQRYIIQGYPITLSPKALSPLFDYSEVDAADNDFSFDFYTTITTGIITGVQKKGLAYQHGLRNDQKLISYDYDLNARFNPITLSVKTKNLNTKNISVPIHKIPKKIKLFNNGVKKL